MSAPLHVREAVVGDLAFLADCNAAMALETERKRLDRGVLERGIAGVFADRRRGFYLVCEDADAALGCLLVTYEWSDWRNGDWWWLQSVYVVPGARRRGVFRALYDAVRERLATDAAAIGLRLYVERDNARAQATYAALGMSETAYRLYELPGAGGP
ncbi:GNAT family N-acetyltransferase [Dokdonella sp.]|uniref:GNAT family N-acetyltransferase n=1 Tax=Dokdonella sp. TaxID=2291710 RepID=UPI002F402DEF